MALFKNRSFLVKLVNDKDAPETEPVEETIDINKIKNHFVRNAPLYLVGFAGFSCLMMRGRYPGIQRVPESGVRGALDGPTKVTVTPLSFFSNRMTNNIITVIERDGRGHPGYLVRCLETNEIFPSQKEAARTMGVYPSLISGHLRGKLPDVDGQHFERVVA
jgi:hypothetical protein